MKKLNWILIGSQVLLIIIIVVMSRSCENNRALAELNQYKLDEYLEERQTFVTEINKQGDSLVSQKLVILSKDRDIEKQLLENSNLKRLNTQIKIKSETKIRDIIAKYGGTPEDNFITETIHDTIRDTIFVNPIGVKFGTPFSVVDPWYATSGKITVDGIYYDSLSFNNDLTITVGRKREKWNKPMESYVEVQSKNPHMNITGLNNVTFVKDKEKIWSKPWFNLLIGTAAGFTIGILAK